MKNLMNCLILVFASYTLSAQSLSPEVVSTAGETYSTHTLSLNWTLGELMTETYAGTINLTQGFHQPVEIATSVDGLVSELGTIRVYPNPSSGKIFVVMEKSGALCMELWDMKGNMVAKKSASTSLENLDLSHLPQGIYVLRLTDNAQRTHSILVKKI